MGLTPTLLQRLRSLPEACGCAVSLIGGNHDRGSHLDGLPHQPSQQLGGLWLSHAPEPQPSSQLLNICGHVHPVARLRQGNDGLRLPCFAFDASEQQLLIPAFGELTGGHECGQRYRKWLVAENAIVPWLDPLSHSPSRRLAR
jgi:metallophosphoesterase superfamily enzyme